MTNACGVENVVDDVAGNVYMCPPNSVVRMTTKVWIHRKWDAAGMLDMDTLSNVLMPPSESAVDWMTLPQNRDKQLPLATL